MWSGSVFGARRFLWPLVLLLALACTGAAPVGMDNLRAGDFSWTPELSPRGPLVVLVRLQAQRAYVYRNGIRIGVSTVSSGRPGYDTPPGIYTVLEKQREHRSNLYDDAPMPFMQRLTWDGLALHGGRLPGYPASHGCIRLPTGFAETLFGATRAGTVVVVESDGVPPTIESPGLFARAAGGAAGTADAATAPTPEPEAEWQPWRAQEGPLSIVLSLRDQQIRVLRNAVPIGRARFRYDGEAPTGTRAWVLLEGRDDAPSTLLPDRPRLRWMRVASPEPGASPTASLDATRLSIPLDFAHAVYDALLPGTTVVVTDESFSPGPAEPVMAGDAAVGPR